MTTETEISTEKKIELLTQLTVGLLATGEFNVRPVETGERFEEPFRETPETHRVVFVASYLLENIITYCTKGRQAPY
jgi:hypothetical protein